MSLFGTLNTGATGLGASSLRLSVIGDNIANINTTGFKGMRASFGDLMANGVGGRGGASQVGTGTGLNTTQTLFGQGTLQASGSALDVAINGQGFFAVRDGDQQMYTRDGSFYMDQDGYLVTGGGGRVQGYGANDGAVTGQIGDLQISTGTADPKATETVGMTASFSADMAQGTALAGLTFDGTTSGTTLTDLQSALGENTDDATGFTTGTTIYDALGVPHKLTLAFERTGENTWEYVAVMDGAEFSTSGYEAEGLVQVASGTLTMADGELDPSNPPVMTNDLADLFPGTTSVWEPAFDFGMDASGEETTGGLVKMEGDETTRSLTQDGYAPGELTALSIGDDGMIRGAYTNGEEIVLGQLALALVSSETGLERMGNGMYRATSASGEPTLDAAGNGPRGSVSGYALEGSNVELETQFVDMISSQRSYQASSRVISTANDILQELVNLV